MSTSYGSGEQRAMKMSLVLYVVILAGKLAAYVVTGVMVLLGEALHTLSDVFKQRLERVMHLKKHALSVAETRAYVEAMLGLQVWAHKLYEAAKAEAHAKVEAHEAVHTHA